MRHEQQEILMLALITRLDQSLPKTDIINARELLKHNEFGVALEHLWTQLYDYDVTIDQQIFDMISELAILMEFEPEDYGFLRELIRI